jgi:hypothetical protein
MDARHIGESVAALFLWQIFVFLPLVVGGRVAIQEPAIASIACNARRKELRRLRDDAEGSV